MTGMKAATFTYSVWVKAADGNSGDTDTRTKSNPCLSLTTQECLVTRAITYTCQASSR